MTIRRNIALLKAAVHLHQTGELPHIPTYVIDLDTVRRNARIMSSEAKSVGVSLYYMSKQWGRNPLINKVVTNAGIKKAVAVESQDAKTLHRYKFPIGNIGQLVPVPRHEIQTILRMKPEVVTIYNTEKAEQISQAAKKLGIKQKLLLRIQDIPRGDFEVPAEQGGFTEDEIPDAVRTISRLDSVEIVGVTTFPAATFNEDSKRVELTPNFQRIRRWASTLQDKFGIHIEQINAPWPTSTAMLKLLAENGATHGEPGHGLMGTTPWHIFSDLPEIPAWVYVTEVLHKFGDKVMVPGGGMGIGIDFPTFMLSCPKFMSSFKMQALIGSDPDTIQNHHAQHMPFGPEFTDYLAMLNPDPTSKIKCGDSVIYAFRPQIFVTRAAVTVVDGIQSNKPKVLGIFDRAQNLIQTDGKPRDDRAVFNLMKKV